MKKTLSKGIFSQSIAFLGAALLASGSATAAIEIDQQPLLVAKPVPGNMAIIGSFEFPTMVTRAYNTSTYTPNSEYIGYFDSGKCYKYQYDNNEEKRHFYPVNENGPSCTGNEEWSGKFLNWASMQSIDIFRHILTGGHRFYDIAGETWLEKGVQTGQGGGNNFPIGNITNNKNLIKQITPTEWSTFKTSIGNSSTAMGNKLRFTGSGDLSNNISNYNPNDKLHSNRNYEVSVRVKVCVAGMLEENCEKYPDGNYKPTGLIQNHSDTMRYSAFGYLNDGSSSHTHGSNRNRKGGIMHARMKYVGPNRVTSENTEEINPNREWDASTGIFVTNPDPTDASATPYGETPVNHSGVISYINRSGHIIPGTQFKTYDNVSELYYTAYRYLKGLENIPSYTDVSDKTGSDRDKLTGGLPIISDWKKDNHDPIQFSCQKNFFLGIGDTNTHNDRGLVSDGKATDPTLAGGSSSMFEKLRNVIHKQEGMNNTSVRGAGTGSDYMAVLAYDANTNDLRPDMVGKQRASTYWIDILETGLKSRRENAYWLAAKYGGLKVPNDFDPINSTATIDDSLWWTSGDVLSTNDRRPDNFYVVNNAQDLANGLVQAFTDIQLEQRGNRSSLALNSTQLEEGSMTFQAQYVSGVWTGDVIGYEIDSTTGSIKQEPKWRAANQLPIWSERKVYFNKDGALALFKNSGKDVASLNKDKAEYLLGNTAKERDGTFRTRQGLLGDIVNSQPVFVGKPRPDLFSTRSFPGQNEYNSWAKGLKRNSVVYIGGNDGMLHGFNAETGAEVFAFIPKTVIDNGLSELTEKNYDHRYFVDGEMTVADVYFATEDKWKTILIGTLGAGGINKARTGTNNAVFALDITDPTSVKLLWEKNSTDIPALGINLGKPVIIQDSANNWKVVLGNGPNSSDEKAHLISINIANGNASASALSNATANGLSSIRAWDSDGDGLTDTLYAGDLQGVVWKITDLEKPTPIKTRLFTAKDKSGVAQPITATPLVGKSPYDQTTWLFFGTGQYLSTSDLANKQLQSWYGIKDNGTNDKLRNKLLERKILQEVAIQTPSGTSTARIIEDGTREDLVGKEGWFIDLYRITNDEKINAGERMITQNQFQGSALISNTRIPDASDPCAPSGLGIIMSINPFTGARLSDSYFDVNENGTINNADLVMINGVPTVVSGIGFDTGFSNPSFLGDKMYVPSDDGTIREIGIQPYSSIVGRTSWRELLNTED